MAETNSEMWLDQTLRAGACGTWWSASTAGGRPLGLLQLEPALLAQPAARERVAATVAAVRAANARGVLRTTELVVDVRRSWLVVATRPTPTLADLLATRPVLGPGAAAGVAVDVGNALRDLHAVGLSHGDLGGDTVVLTGAGAATLVEVGVLAAVRDLATDVGHDAGAWARLTRALAANATAPEADLLLAAATTAETGDLTTAVRRLAAGAAGLTDFLARDSLAAALPAVVSAPSRVPTQPSPVHTSIVDAPMIDPGPAVDPPANAESWSAVRIRFGRGVPEAAVLSAPAANLAAITARRRPWRTVAVAAASLLLLLGAGAVFWWFHLLG